MADDEWWRGAVIYQVYPRSFQDTSGNGIGDLPGITQRLEHIARLGVEALWISPFFKSPMADYGYDVEDYREVDPLFGSIDDFDRLLEKAHGLGLKLLIDFVACHTSDQHAWFKEARLARNATKADWYVFAEASDDGTPPNNWLSVFGGPAWTWEPRRGQYYLHNFLASQPQLNWQNPAVQDAMLAEAEFWLKRGVDGFRIDAIDFALHDEALRDNPARPRDSEVTGGMARGSPYARQIHVHQKGHPELSAKVLRPLQGLAGGYNSAFLLGEISGDRTAERLASYTDGGGLDAAYTFELLRAAPTPDAIRQVIEAIEHHIGDGWPCYSLSNHDVTRAVSRYGSDADAVFWQPLMTALLCCLRGTVCLYQGEELGLTEADIPFDDLQDPFGIAFYPTFKGRDGCRTPMPWVGTVGTPTAGGAPAAGFSTVEPWLPVPDDHRRLGIDLQERDPGSVLERTKRFLAWRNKQQALKTGSITFRPAPKPILAIERRHQDQWLLCCFNLGGEEAAFDVDEPIDPACGHGFDARIGDAAIALPAYGAFFGYLSARTK